MKPGFGMAASGMLPPHSPSPRQNISMAYDAARNQVVLFGGSGAALPGNLNGVLGDTWVWNGVDWTDMTPSMI